MSSTNLSGLDKLVCPVCKLVFDELPPLLHHMRTHPPSPLSTPENQGSSRKRPMEHATDSETTTYSSEPGPALAFIEKTPDTETRAVLVTTETPTSTPDGGDGREHICKVRILQAETYEQPNQTPGHEEANDERNITDVSNEVEEEKGMAGLDPVANVECRLDDYDVSSSDSSLSDSTDSSSDSSSETSSSSSSEAAPLGFGGHSNKGGPN